MTFKLKADLENAAFEDGCSGNEMARILRKLADQLEGMALTGERGTLQDFNGNTIGQWNVA